MYEHRRKPLLSRADFARRVLFHALAATALVIFSLGIGMLGYHFLCNLPWEDAFLNASMILTGMGPVSPLSGTMAKIFASCYALYSGIAFLTMVALTLAPILHRFLHKFHLGDDDDR